jgi:hypothetical protein
MTVVGPSASGEKGTSQMEPRAIFELIVQADEKLKYAKPGVADARATQARALLRQAIEEARAIGDDALVQQAERRMHDLDALGAAEDPAPG